MNYKIVLTKLEDFLNLIEESKKDSLSTEESREVHKKIYEKYGEVEDVIERFIGRQKIEVPSARGGVNVYPNFIEAGYLSGRTFHRHQGYTQLIKIIGKVRQLAENPLDIRDERSIGNVVQILQLFRECCQYLRTPPDNERDVQDIVWIILRSHFNRLEREETLPKFGVKAYVPDFGIPELRLLIEVKYIGPSTDLSRIQEGILADIPGYLSEHGNYDGIVVFVYDSAQKLRDSRKFIEDLKSVEGIIDVLVIPGVN